jgi:hypothetical protein
MMKKATILFLGLGLILNTACQREGCTDPLANNYEKKADTDDGSCEYDPSVISEELTDDITTPTTLQAKNYKICTDIYVSSELTLVPGTKLIMCEGSSITIESSGYLNATGTAEKPIEIKGETNTKGYWAGIAFKSNNPNNKLIHTTVSDGGTYWGWEYATVYVSDNAQLTVENSAINNSDNFGLFVQDGGQLASFSTNTFGSNSTGLSLRADQVSKLDGATNYNNGNIFDYIEVRTGDISVPQVWQATTTPLLVNSIDVESSLELLPGTKILMAASQSIDVTSSGSIKSVGTAANPITIKGKEIAAGYWSGLKIESNSPNNKLAFTTVSDGGDYWGYEYSNIYVNGRLDIANCTIGNANSYGMYVNSGGLIFANGSAQTNAAAVESQNTFVGNGTGADANCTNGCTVFFE